MKRITTLSFAAAITALLLLAASFFASTNTSDAQHMFCPAVGVECIVIWNGSEIVSERGEDSPDLIVKF